MLTTEALVLKEINGPFSLEEVLVHDINDDEALIEIHATGICHTDLSCANGTLPASAPAVLGHEGAGVVLSVGRNVENVQKGDKVLLSFAHCETCAQCTSGHPAHCESWVPLNFGGKRTDGSSTLSLKGTQGEQPLYSSFFGQSSFARVVAVKKSSLVKVDPSTDLALFSPLGCGFQTGAGAVLNTLDVQPGSTVAVFGAGAVGMSAIMAAKIRDARRIIAIDLMQTRLDLAQKLGATDTILGNEPEILARIREICPPNGVDYALDCTGVPAVVGTMIEALGIRGKAVSVGAPSPGKKVDIDIFAHLIHGKQYSGCCEGDSLPKELIQTLIGEHANGRFPIQHIVSVYNVEDFQQAIDDTKSGKTLKAVLNWSRK
ncbi:alcohol dehydrogenase [Pestalotiopsis sp. NC0098]|nr:alcohol dehydrogenase [Pestalotiopsis sp. NC0098]